MWPWGQPATSNQSFQPPAAFPHQHIHHVTPLPAVHQVNPQGANAPPAFVGYQQPHFVAASAGGSELSHSHPGIGYGIPGMVSLPVPSPWSQEGGLSHATNVVSPHPTDPHLITAAAPPAGGGGSGQPVVPGASPAAALSYHSPHEELPGAPASLSHMGTNVSPTAYVPPPSSADTASPTLHQPPPPPPPSDQATVVQELVTLVSPNPAYPPPPPPQAQQQQPHTGTPPHPHSLTPPQPHSFTTSSPANAPSAQHIHSSSPFSVDYLLRGNPPPTVVEPGGMADDGHDQSYVRPPQSQLDLQEENSNPADIIVPGGAFGGEHGHHHHTGFEMRQDIPTGGWSITN